MTAAENMALDETLLEVKGEGKSPNTIRFLQFSPRTVLVGFHQAVSEEIRIKYCRERGIDINRRITGGGAIFFDENQLGWEVFCDKAFFDIPLPNARLFKSLCDPLVQALGMLNIRAEFRPRNDIEVNGRKISGTGGTESDGAFMFQGTMLVDFDVETMLRALKIPVEKLKAKEIDSVKDRVTCLKWELGAVPALDALKHAIRSGFEDGLNIRLTAGGLTQEEQRRFEDKLAHFQSPEWIDKVRPRFQKRDGVQASYKAEAGMVRFTLVVNPPQKRLKDIYITGDFLSFPGRALYDLEAELRGAPLDRDDPHAMIRRRFDDGSLVIPGLDFADFVVPLDQCLKKIDIARHGVPLEHCNLISVVNGSFEDVIRRLPSSLLLPYCAKFTECDLLCDHCRGTLLKPMIPAGTPAELADRLRNLSAKGHIGALISGGCDQRGRLPWDRFVPAIRKIKAETDLQVSVHSGMVDDETALKLKGAGVDQALIDVIGDDDTYGSVCHVPFGVDRIEAAMASLQRAGIPMVPHIVCGLHYGKMRGEKRAVAMISRFQAAAVVIVALMNQTTKYTKKGETTNGVNERDKAVSPTAEAVADIIAEARLAMPETPISLGCARKRSDRRMELLAIDAGVNRMALPSDEAVEKAKGYGLEICHQKTCCSVTPVLYYRLNVISIAVPPLRARGGDVGLLARHWVENLCRKLNRAPKTLSPAALDRIETHKWPGNVRELVNAIEHAVNMSAGQDILVEHLPADLQRDAAKNRQAQAAGVMPLKELEKDAIKRALVYFGGNITQASKSLGIGRNTLYDKMNKYGIR